MGTATRGPGMLRMGALEIDPSAYRATLRGEVLSLTPSQLEVLSALVASPHRVVTRAELAKVAHLEQSRSVDVALSSLRRLLGDGVIRNVRNRGWILEPRALAS